MNIRIKTRDVYGQTLYDPACDKARIFARMLGTKTLTRSALECLNEAGIAITVESGNNPDWLSALSTPSN